MWMEANLNLEKLIEDGLTLKEISIKLECSISTVKRKMSLLGLKSKVYSIKNEVVVCLNCESSFYSLKSEGRKFCSNSCSSTYNNSLRIKKERSKEKRIRFYKKVIGKCIHCSNDIVKKNGRNQAKYCSTQCQSDYQMEDRIHNGVASTRTLKIFLIKKYGDKCMKCEWCEINPSTNKVPIELEHKDGNSDNNVLENLELLCPNCHSLTPTYKALNKGNGRHKRRERYKEGKSF